MIGSLFAGTEESPGDVELYEFPVIVLDPKESHTSRLAKVAITTASYGISTAGTVYRMDDVPITLRPALPSPYPSDEEVVNMIIAAVAKKPGWSPATNVRAANVDRRRDAPLADVQLVAR